MTTSVFATAVVLSTGDVAATPPRDDPGVVQELDGGAEAAFQGPNATGFQNETLVSGGQPMGIQFLSTDDDYNRFLLLQKTGEILIVNATTGNTQTYMTLPSVDSGGESGLIDVTLDPNFEQNGYFYVYYSPGSPDTLRIARFTHQENQGGLTSSADPSSEMVVWEDGQQSNGHVGGGLDFGPQGALWLTVGEQHTGGQDPGDSPGNVIRVNPDGSIPQTNPYYNDGDSNTLGEVFAMGLRNPFTAGWEDVGGDHPRFYIADVGGNQGSDFEEINVLTPQDITNASQNGDVVNFGWDECEDAFDNNNVPTPCPIDQRTPFWSYVHNSTDVYTDGSISHGTVYDGTMFPSEYQGAYFFMDQSRDWMKYMTFHANGSIEEVATFDDEVLGGPIDAAVGPNGAMYVTKIAKEQTRYPYIGVEKITYEDPTDTTPEVSASTTSINIENGTSDTIDISASDADGDAVKLTASGLPSFASFSDHGDDTGTLTLSPGADDDGAYQVTVTGEDDDNNSDSVTIDINVFEAGQPTPDDFDGDGTPNENDPDDDNDGTPDTEDLFPLDPNDGTTTSPPINLEFDQNSHPNTILGLGFTGVMNNGDGYESLYDPSEVTIEDSSLTIHNVDGYPDNTPSNQVHGYQVGINPPDEPFAVNTTVSGLPADPQDVQILGLHVGTGDQSNYAKFVMGADEPRLEFSHEVDGTFTMLSNENTHPDLVGPDDPETQLSLVIYPDQGLIESWYKPEGGDWTHYMDKDIPAVQDWLDTTDGGGLAVGLQATTNTASFDATYHNLTVQTLASIGDNSAPTADAGADQTVDEGSTVTLDASGSNDPDGDTLSYSWSQQSGPSVALSDSTAEQPTFTAPEVDGDQTLTFEVTVDDGQLTATDTVSITVEDTTAATSSIANAIAGSDDVIGPNDLQDGVFYWQSGDPVPGTDGETIDDVSTLQNLVFHWQNGTQFDANLAPTASISVPSDGDTFQEGETLSFQGSATDPEEGQLGGSSLEWYFAVQHSGHNHQIGTVKHGESGTFVPEVPSDHDADEIGYLVRLTANDSQGATDVTEVELDPETSNITVDSSPQGIEVEFGPPLAPVSPTPYSQEVVVGNEKDLGALQSACIDGTEYTFDGWSDGTTSTERTVTAQETDTSYTAEYTAGGPCNVHSARFSVTEGFQNRDTSPWLFPDSVNITNTGTVPITSVSLDASTAAFPDLQAVGMKDGYSGSASGQTMTIDFSGDLVMPGESALGNIDFNHDTSGGVTTSTPCPCHQAYEISGLEMVGTTVTVEYDDGTTQTTTPWSDGSPAGGVAVADSDVPAAPEVHYPDVFSFDSSVLGTPHKAATVSSAQQQLHLHGPPDGTVRVLRLEGQMNVTGTAGDTIGNVEQYIEEPYEANRFYITKNEQVVQLDGQGQSTATITLTNNTDAGNQDYAGVNYVLAVVEGEDGDTGMLADVAVLKYVPDGVNQAPTAVAGADQTVDEGSSVSLNASGSSDPDGDTLSYQWTQTAGTSVTLSDATTAEPSFTAPEVSGDETLTFEVEVNDSQATDTDVVNVTVQDTDTGASQNDFDGDGTLNANDPDDDGDGIPDTSDVFAADPTDGTGADAQLPIELSLDPNSDPVSILGVGFTGLMNNGQDWMDVYDPANVTVGSLHYQVVTGTYPNHSPSNLRNGFQFGVDTPEEPFAINATVSGLPPDPGHVENLGIQIGDGTQDSFMKLMIGDAEAAGGSDPKVEFSYEFPNEGFYSDKDYTSVAGLAGPDDPKTQLSLIVYPNQGEHGTVEAYYKPEGGSWTHYVSSDSDIGSSIAIPSDSWLNESDGKGLAVGVIAEAVNVSSDTAYDVASFNATWHNVSVTKLPQEEELNSSSKTTVTPNTGTEGSTYHENAFNITNTGESNITAVTIDLSTGAFPDMVFDPNGTAGDQVGAGVSIDSESDSVGVVSTDDGDVFSQPHNGVNGSDGYDVLTLEFTEFEPGETFAFSPDNDPTSIKKATLNSQEAGPVSGLEISRATVSVEYDNGDAQTGQLFGDGSAGGSNVSLDDTVEDSPGLDSNATVPALNTGFHDGARVTEPVQTVEIQHPGQDGQVATVIRAEGELNLSNVPDYNGTPGYEIEDFEANTVELAEYKTVTLTGTSTNVTFTLTNSTDVGGYNYIFAAVKNSEGEYGNVSNVEVLKLVPEPAKDFDDDGIANANDPDDDNDGAVDTVDPFAIDPDNGTTTTLPVELNLSADSHPNTILDVGFTGMMVNGSDYQDLYDPSQVTIQNSALTVENMQGLKVPEDPYSNLEHGFQFGINPPDEPFAINTTVSGMPSNPQDTQIIGMQVGPGDQDNFYKFVYGASEPRVEFSHEFDGNWNYDDDQTAISGLTGPDKQTQLSLVVYPTQATVEAWYKPEGGNWTLEHAKTNLPSEWLDTADGSGLAVGTLATSTADPFDPTWHEFTVQKLSSIGGGDTNTAPTADAGADQTVDEGTMVTLNASGSSDPDGDALTYQWTQESGPGVTLSDATTEQPTFTAPEVSGDDTLTFEVEVDDSVTADTDVVNVTVTDTDAQASPSDWDGDGILNENDPDDDNDGWSDTADPFAIDPDNGTTTTLPISLDFEQGPHPNTILGVGWTGLMMNGTDYGDLYDPADITIENSSLTYHDVGPYYPDSDSLKHGYQIGFAPPNEPFRVNATVSGLPANPQEVQVFGIQLGLGDQSNYMKLLIGSDEPKVEFSHEFGNGFVTDDDETAVPALAGPDKKTNLSMVVFPSNNTVEAYYETEGGDWTHYANKTMPSGWLDTSDGSGLAVGLVATSTADPFDATWHEVSVETLNGGS